MDRVFSFVAQWLQDQPLERWEREEQAKYVKILSKVRTAQKTYDNRLQLKLNTAKLICLTYKLDDAVFRAKNYLAHLRAMRLVYTPRHFVRAQPPFPGPEPLLYEIDQIDIGGLQRMLRAYGLRRSERREAIDSIPRDEWEEGHQVYTYPKTYTNDLEESRWHIRNLEWRINTIIGTAMAHVGEIRAIHLSHIPADNVRLPPTFPGPSEFLDELCKINFCIVMMRLEDYGLSEEESQRVLWFAPGYESDEGTDEEDSEEEDVEEDDVEE